MKESLIIEIEWYGPFLMDDILYGTKKIFGKMGLYQIYGSHPVNGGDNLLYIGYTAENFRARFRNHHNDWIKHEVSEIQEYLGVIWTDQPLPPDQEILFLQQAEKLLTYYSAPPYNSSLIYDIRLSDIFKDENIRIINLWKKHRLPYEVSTHWYYSNCWNSKRELIHPT